MALLVSTHQISKTMGSKLLFEGLSFGVEDSQKVGLLGPNGAGKSTLLKILAGLETVDGGEVSQARGIRIAYVAQEERFDENQSIQAIAEKHLKDFGLEELDAQVQASIYLSMVGFENLEQKVKPLSGGWRKRLSLAIAFAKDPELLLLDEPTNHMDWDGILWLEGWLSTYKKSFLVVSHDRAFLEKLCTRTMEINRLYDGGFLAFNCGYEKFLEKKQEYIQTQLALQSSMANKARREVEWLRAGVKARTTKSQSRIKEAHQLLDDLDQVKQRNLSTQAKVRLEIDSAGKYAKKMIDLKQLNVAYGDQVLVKDLDLLMGPRTCVGFLGSNGSGKTSLLKVIAGQAVNYTGERFVNKDLQIVYFDQKRESLPQDKNLMEFLGGGSDYVVFKNQSTHVAAYASRFLFSSEKMQLKISQLSGGEQARLLIAKLLLQPADVLILDEPTNDLDIDSIEVLEDNLQNFEGLVLLVSHDRYFLSNLCDKYVALDGQGGWIVYPDLNQWLNSQDNKPEKKSEKIEAPVPTEKPKSKVKLSYKEKRQLETMEADIEKAETALADAQAELEDPKVLADHLQLKTVTEKVESCQKTVDGLYELWTELSAKQE